MPMMLPGRGTPTMRWRTSPAIQMAKMTASWSGILMTAVKVEKVIVFYFLKCKLNFTSGGVSNIYSREKRGNV